MKRAMFFVLAMLFIVFFSSCTNRGENARLAFAKAFYKYAYYEDSLMFDYILKIHEDEDYRLDLDDLRDSIKIECEKIVSMSFDSLYMRYGETFVCNGIYKYNGVICKNKEELHKHYVNLAIGNIYKGIRQELIIKASMNPNEEELRRQLEKYTIVVFKPQYGIEGQ